MALGQGRGPAYRPKGSPVPGAVGGAGVGVACSDAELKSLSRRPVWQGDSSADRFKTISVSHEVVMTDVSPKEVARRAVERLPEDATLEDAMERLYLIEKIEQGRTDVRAGRAVVHEELVRRFGV